MRLACTLGENPTSMFTKYRGENCNKWGEQKSNLTEEEEEGLQSLKQIIKNKEIVILKTDKTGKFCVMDRDKYKEVGEKQIEGEIEVDRREIMRREQILNSHSAMWYKFSNMREAHGQKDRIWESKRTKSENLANMYLLAKDHKAEMGWRKVVTGAAGGCMQ